MVRRDSITRKPARAETDARMHTLADFNARYEQQSHARVYLEYVRAAALTHSTWQAVNELERRRGLHDPFVAPYRKAADVHTTADAAFLAKS